MTPDEIRTNQPPAAGEGGTACPFKVGDKIRQMSNHGETATVTAIVPAGFQYEHEERTFCHPLMGTSKGGTCFPNGYFLWELVPAPAPDAVVTEADRVLATSLIRTGLDCQDRLVTRKIMREATESIAAHIVTERHRADRAEARVKELERPSNFGA